MRVESAAMAKGYCNPSNRQDIPAAGTRVRQVFDLLLASKGLPIAVNLSRFGDGRRFKVEYLRDSYGLDIRYLGRGRWVLAGEWVGPEYRDFIAEKIAASDQEAALS